MLSVCLVSFNSTTPRAQSFTISITASDLPLRTIKFCSVVFGVTLKLLVINTSSSSPANTKRCLLTVSPTCHCPAPLDVLHLAVEPLTTRGEARYWPRIAIFAYITCIQRPRSGESSSQYCHNVWWY